MISDATCTTRRRESLRRGHVPLSYDIDKVDPKDHAVPLVFHTTTFYNLIINTHILSLLHVFHVHHLFLHSLFPPTLRYLFSIRLKSVSLNFTFIKNKKVEHYIKIKIHKFIILRFKSDINPLCELNSCSLVLYFPNKIFSVNLTNNVRVNN